MNIDQRLRWLESQSNNKPRSPSQQKYLTAMIEASGCGLTQEQLDDGQNLGILELVLKAYGLGSKDKVITDVPKL